MSDRALELKSASALGLSAQAAKVQPRDLPRLIADWLIDGECRLYSKATIEGRGQFMKNLFWFLNREKLDSCGPSEFRAFFAYLARPQRAKPAQGQQAADKADTGMRSSEMWSLRVKDIDFANRRCEVLGKGNKYRTVFFGRNASRALSQHLRSAKSEADAPTVFGGSWQTAKAGLTRSGLQRIVRKIGVDSGIKASLSPHAFRRTFAVEILKNDANVLGPRKMLGHTNLQMTQIYLLLAQADVEAQHRQFSPADRPKAK